MISSSSAQARASNPCSRHSRASSNPMPDDAPVTTAGFRLVSVAMIISLRSLMRIECRRATENLRRTQSRARLLAALGGLPTSLAARRLPGVGDPSSARLGHALALERTVLLLVLDGISSHLDLLIWSSGFQSLCHQVRRITEARERHRRRGIGGDG